jgi:hypothetical protein
MGCNKKITRMESLISVKCAYCGDGIHRGCSSTALDFRGYSNNRVTYKKACFKCAEENSLRFDEKRHCHKCQSDITVSESKADRCASCGEIVCRDCMANTILPDKVLDAYNFDEYSCCSICNQSIGEMKRTNKTLQTALASYKAGFDLGYKEGYDEGLGDGDNQ